MFSIPTMIPAVLRTRIERFEARRAYNELEGARSETLDDLRTFGDHDDRALLLDEAADLTDQLAKLHTVVWGRNPDADGRPMAICLRSQAKLLRQVAATERAVFGMITWSDTDLSQTEVRTIRDTHELLDWAMLAHTSAPDLRAVYLRRLHGLVAENVGDRAAEVLVVLAEVEEHRATGVTRRPARPRYMLPRVVGGAVLTFVALVVLVPSLNGLGRIVVLVGVLAVAYVALCVYVGVRGRSQEVDR